MIVECSARQNKWYPVWSLTNNRVYWLLLKGWVAAINIVRSELVQIPSQLIILKLQPRRRSTGSLIFRVKMFFVNFVTFAFCKVFFCHDSLENDAGVDAFKWFPYQLPNKHYIITTLKICAFFVLAVHLWAFWWKPCNSTANSCKMTVH